MYDYAPCPGIVKMSIAIFHISKIVIENDARNNHVTFIVSSEKISITECANLCLFYIVTKIL